MPEVTNSGGPIFVGGTGRSGTSVMADILNSHPQIVLPAHENKLIVEKDGLKDLVDQLSGRFDMKRHHYAVANFARWARTLRALGFRDPKLNAQVQALRTEQRMGFHKACEVVARQNPGAPLSIHAVGFGFDVAHYDRCVNGFIRRLCLSVVDDGIMDTEGLIKPFIIPRPFARDEILAECRAFLDELYAPALERASATRWCDDSPDSWMYLDFLYELRPDMKFIHMIRDPRDVIGSYMKQVWAPSDPKVIVAMFKAQFADYERLKSRIPADRVMEIRLEDLSGDKAGVMDELSRFLGLENRFNAEIFAQDRTNTGNYADTLGQEALKLLEAELSGWMGKHRYLA